MPDYAIVNLLEIDDENVQGRVEGWRAGSAASTSARATSASSHWTLRAEPALARAPTATASRRRPTSSSAGSGRVRLDDEIHDVRQWDVVRVAPAVVRAFEARPGRARADRRRRPQARGRRRPADGLALARQGLGSAAGASNGAGSAVRLNGGLVRR